MDRAEFTDALERLAAGMSSRESGRSGTIDYKALAKGVFAQRFGWLLYHRLGPKYPKTRIRDIYVDVLDHKDPTKAVMVVAGKANGTISFRYDFAIADIVKQIRKTMGVQDAQEHFLSIVESGIAAGGMMHFGIDYAAPGVASFTAYQLVAFNRAMATRNSRTV